MHHLPPKRCYPVPAPLLILALVVAGAAADEPPAGFVAARGDKLFLAGAEYRAIGVNVPHLHQACFGTWLHINQIYGTAEKARLAMVTALDDARDSRIAFIRFFASPGYPRDVDLLYAKDPAEYWRRMDELFALCRTRRLKLVPSLGTLRGWHLYCGEPARAILDPKSKTREATLRYVREFVGRYRDDPTVLLWELENEAMLAADVDRAGADLLPKTVYSPGAVVREKGTREDSLTWTMVHDLYREQAAFIKQLDPNHPVTSGDASVRIECTSRRETFPDFRFRKDTLREWLGNNLSSQPEPLDVFSFHAYGSFAPGETWDAWRLSSLDLLRRLARACRAAGAPVFLGELGQDNPSFREDPEAKWTLASIDALEEEGVSLAALWVWHFPWQPDRTLTGKTHPRLTARVAAFNRKHAGLR